MCKKIDTIKLKELFGISSYHALHTNIRKRYGNATHCSNKDCSYPNPKRFEWALKKGREYSLNIEDYIPLCPSCHRKYDFTVEAKKILSEKGKQRKGLKSFVAKMVLDTQTGVYYYSVKEASAIYGIKRTTLIMMLKGKNPNKTNLIYA